MVSSSHEAMHRIFLAAPELVARTMQVLNQSFAEPVAVTELPTDLTELRPLERRVDSLLRVDTADPASSFLLVVESQTKKARDKPAAWLYYLGYLYAKYRIPPVLLVTCQDRATALWASQEIRIGPTVTLAPLVLGPHNVPAVTDPEEASADIPLAVLSAITHSKDPDVGAILKALAAALKTLDAEAASVYIEYTEQSLGTTPAADMWRDLMAVDLSFFRSETAQKLRREGMAEGKAEAIVRLLAMRGLGVPDEVRGRVFDCADPETLDLWFARAFSAATADQLFDEV